MPIGGAHGCLPNSNLQTQDFVLGAEYVDSKALAMKPRNGGLFHDPACASSPSTRMPVSDQLCCSREQNINPPIAESEQHAALSIPSNFHFHPFRLNPRAWPAIWRWPCDRAVRHRRLTPGKLAATRFTRKSPGGTRGSVNSPVPSMQPQSPRLLCAYMYGHERQCEGS